MVFNHGIYVPQGLIGEAARSLNIPVVNWNPAYRKKCFIFSHGDSYHHTLMTEPTDVWENLVLTSDQEHELETYLKSRWFGSQDWIWFHEDPRFGEEDIRRAVGADPGKPWIGLLTNVLWDAQLHYPANAFPTLLEWLFMTIMISLNGLIFNWSFAYIRLTNSWNVALPSTHCGRDPSRRGRVLPKNVFLVGPESPVSTYALMERCDSVLIFGTKTGVELTSQGIPVIVAGEAWIRGKGDHVGCASSRPLSRVIGSSSLRAPLLCPSNASCPFVCLPLFLSTNDPSFVLWNRVRGIPPFGVPPGFRLASLGRPGADLGLDVVCDGILKGNPFVFPAERAVHSSRRMAS